MSTTTVTDGNDISLYDGGQTNKDLRNQSFAAANKIMEIHMADAAKANPAISVRDAFHQARAKLTPQVRAIYDAGPSAH